MVYTKESEYGRAFKSNLECYAKIYEDNFEFRRQRRNSQYAHHSELFEWDEQDVDSTGSEDLNLHQVGRSAKLQNLPPHKYKHEKFNKNYHAKRTKPVVAIAGNGRPTADNTGNKICQCQEKLVNGIFSSLDSAQSETGVSHHDHGVQTPDWDKLRSRKPSKANAQKNIHDGNVTPQNHNVPAPETVNGTKSSRPKKPLHGAAYRKPLPKPRPMSAPLGRPARKPEPKVKVEHSKSPFLPYGFLDQERETAVKKTHNVRASCDVYPAARRAYLRRQTQIEQREEELKKPPRRRVERQDSFTEKMTRQTAGWETEYRHHYVPYERSLYQRALSARLDPKKYAENLSATA